MLGHLGINVPDLTAARAYYARLLPALGYEPFVDDDDQFAYLPADGRSRQPSKFSSVLLPEPLGPMIEM